MGEFAVKLSVRRMAASRVFSRVLLFYLVLVLFFGGDLVTRVKDMIRRYRWKQSFRK